MSHTYAYPRPALTVDCVVFGLADGSNDLQILLIQRALEPFAGQWALPGGYVEMDEDLETAAARELREETGARVDYLEQLYTFGKPGRDPRGRTVSVAYYGLVRSKDHALQGGSDASRAVWVSVSRARDLAFDHDDIVYTALQRLRGKIVYEPIGFNLLPRKFTLGQLQALYETILDRALDRRNFRKKLLGMGILVEAGKQTGVPNRPATLYRFDKKAYDQACRQGLNFEL